MEIAKVEAKKRKEEDRQRKEKEQKKQEQRPESRLSLKAAAEVAARRILGAPHNKKGRKVVQERINALKSVFQVEKNNPTPQQVKEVVAFELQKPKGPAFAFSPPVRLQWQKPRQFPMQ
eukprot:symbB.v1.2.005914.t1/scaffold347.1/size224350/9